MPTELFLPFDEEPPAPGDPLLARDESARAFAVDPSRNVVLEASAGTGKTRVLVTRYINLLRAGVDPANILAITFTRKAAAEMRERILRDLRALAGQSAADAARWRALGDRLGEIAISTIDAFCLSLLREFPLEADLDPGFQVADETEVPRLADEALDAALRAGRRIAGRDADVALLLASLGERNVRAGLSALLGRRLVAARAIRRFVDAAPGQPPDAAMDQAAARLGRIVSSGEGGLEAFLADGPASHPAFALVAADLRILSRQGGEVRRSAIDRLAAYFLTNAGGARTRPAPSYRKDQCPSPAAWTRHSRALAAMSPHVAEALASLERELNRAMARGVRRLFRVADWRYRRALEEQAAVDFTEGLARTLSLLRRMDEFAQSRYRLEARYHHILVDEFQDTSQAQWTLVARLVEAWGEGIGLAHDAPLQPSIFVVGDRKQSIYAFRDADVRLLRRARRHIGALRPADRVRRSIARSFRSSPALLAFTNDLFGQVEQVEGRPDGFRYGRSDRFPVHLATSVPTTADALGLAAGAAPADVAASVAAEIDRLLAAETVRDRQTGVARAARPGDIAILFRSRESHRVFEAALERRRIPAYVYKGLGFFDADEVKDLVALLRFLADPSSDAHAAALLRSRVVRLSDRGLRSLAPGLAASLTAADPEGLPLLDDEDRRVLSLAREAMARWLALVDRVPPAEVLDRVLDESAYAFELGDARRAQARENVKKVRGLLRRIQNRGYATLPRIADQLERLSAGDESNAVVDAVDAVNLMTVHAAKGLEFPVVFLVNLGRGTGTRSEPILLISGPAREGPLVSIAGGLPEAEEAARQRDLEETKRLLYVAVTRARERLYLSAVLKDGRFRPGRGSLGEVLPRSLREVFDQAGQHPGAGRVEWPGLDGRVHPFRLCPAGGLEDGDAPARQDAPVAAIPAAEPPDFAAWRDEGGAARLGVAAESLGDEPAAGGDETGAQARRPGGGADARLVGTLVHRLFQAAAPAGSDDLAALTERARQLLSADEPADPLGARDVAGQAAAAYLDLRRRPDVTSVLDAAQCMYEVPFSLGARRDGRAVVVRGAIDCLARRADGSLVVLEIKTGRPRDWHAAQLEWYVRAARALFPGARVEGRVVYP